jgi:hypothetical protein
MPMQVNDATRTERGTGGTRSYSGGRVTRAAWAWQAWRVSETAPARTWLTIPDVSEQLSSTPGRVRKMIEDHHLLAVRRDKTLVIPAVFIRDGEPLPELRGTIFVLQDMGFSPEESMDWLLEVEDSLGVAPIDALLAGRKAEVRRIAQALG